MGKKNTKKMYGERFCGSWLGSNPKALYYTAVMRFLAKTFLFIAGKTVTPWDDPQGGQSGKSPNAYSQQLCVWEMISTNALARGKGIYLGTQLVLTEY